MYSYNPQNPKGTRQNFLASELDGHNMKAPPKQPEEAHVSPVKGKNPTQNKKLENLTSNITSLAGANANKFYHNIENKGEVVHLKLANMGPDMDEAQLKKIAGAKHVISAEVELDALKGTCKGKGSIQIRLNEGEDAEAIRQKFVNKGIIVQDNKIAPQKDSTFTRPIY